MGYLRRPKGRKTWYFQTSIGNKKIIWSTGETSKPQALKKVPELEERARLLRERLGSFSALNDDGGDGNGKLRLSAAFEREVERIKTDVSVSQSERIDYALTNFVEWVKDDILVTDVTTALLEDYQRARLKIRAQATVDKELIYVIRALKKCGHLVIKPDPKPGIKTKQRPFTIEELKAFFKACDVYPQDEPGRYKTMFLTMLATGARPAEVLYSKKSSHKPLLKSEVLEKEQRIIIRPSKILPGKEGKPRSVPVSKMLIDLLKEEYKKTPEKWPFVFRSRTNLFRLFRLIAKKANLKLVDELDRKITAHCFRHTYATHANVLANGDVFKVMEALGHSQISTTAIYVEAKIPDLSMDLTKVVDTPDPNDPEIFMGEGI